MKQYNFDYLWNDIRQWFDDELKPKFKIKIFDLHNLPFSILAYTMTDENDNFRITACLTLKQYIYLENKLTGISMEFKYINPNKLSIQDLKKMP